MFITDVYNFLYKKFQFEIIFDCHLFHFLVEIIIPVNYISSNKSLYL